MASSSSSTPFVRVESANCQYTESTIESTFEYHTTRVVETERGVTVRPETTAYRFRTQTKVPKTGVLLVGLGGNNGSTVTAGIIANREGITWRTRKGVERPNYFGSLTQAATVRLGVTERGEDYYLPVKDLLPMVNPNDLVVGGWDISSLNLADAMERAAVLDYDLQRQLVPYMKDIKPMPSIFFPDFIAANQGSRADNVLRGSHSELLEHIRGDIRRFREENSLEKVIVLWTANTERFAVVEAGLNTTWEELQESIRRNESEVAPSQLFAVAAILEHCSYINGSPQNTFVPGVVDLAEREGVYIGGDDFKSGQTKMKSVLVDFLVGAGLKPESIVSYNHLGNNDGMNLSAPAQFRSKEISKSNVVDDMVASNHILYEKGEHPDHVVVIKYVPHVGDSKRAMDEYTSTIFMNGQNTIVMHNTCEDSLLAAPLILDLIILTELFERVTWKTDAVEEYQNFHPVLALLSYLCKAPMVPPGTPVVNALAKQRAAIENVMRACLGLQPENCMLLEHKAIPRSQWGQWKKLAEYEDEEVAGASGSSASVVAAPL